MPEDPDPSAPGDAILLEGLRVPAALGVTAAERQMRRPVRLDIELGLDLSPAGRSDELADTLDYQSIHDTVVKVAGEGEHRLVEALGERIAEALFASTPAAWIRVAVRKSAPIAGAVDRAGVRLLRRRPPGEGRRAP